jgi:hypothetical protein
MRSPCRQRRDLPHTTENRNEIFWTECAVQPMQNGHTVIETLSISAC